MTSEWSGLFSRRNLVALAAAWPPLILASGQARSAFAATQAGGAAPRQVSAEFAAEIQRRNAELSATWLNGDVDRRMTHYAADSVSNPDYQPRLYGPGSIARYYRALASRQRVGVHARRTTEVMSLSDETALELGRLEAAYALAADGVSHSHQGRYANLWRRQPGGAVKLKAEVWGYFERIENPASYSLGERETTGRAALPGDPAVEAELAKLNVLDAMAVKTHDAPAKIARYADDAVLMPYADTPKVGIDAIRAHLIRYTDQGRGVAFESVRVWNEGFEVLDGYVVEYPKFEVRWRNGADAGIVSGGGLRLWRRQADGALKMLRQIATHDYRA
jgi:ketosteroid isomerase-like protein